MASSILQQEQLLIQKYESVGRQRILIVNHEDDVNFALKLVIEEEGQILDKRNRFQVDSFNDLILALKDYEKGYYDLLLIGVVMPKINGFELAKEIRKMDDRVKICFLIAGEVPNKVRFNATSSSAQEEENRDRFIRLPIENKDLIEHIDRMVYS